MRKRFLSELPYSYMWINSSHTGATVSGLAFGNYAVAIIDSNGCRLNSHILISQPDEIQITTSSTNATTNQNNGTATVVNIYEAVSPFSFAWSNGDTTRTIYDLSPGTYTVTLTDHNGCQKTATEVIYEVTGISLVSEDFLFNIYPNPANSNVIVTVSELKEETQLSLKNVLGQTLFTKTISSLQTNIDLSGFAPGIYLTELIQREKTISKKIIISR